MKIISAGAVVASAALLLSACGSSSSTSTTGSIKSPQSFVAKAYEFSACMRNHGVTDFPDPKVTSNGNGQQIAIQAVGANTPAFKTATKACQGILPAPSNADLAAAAAQRRAHTQDLLSFARCMRNKGVNGFPDPGAQGQLTLAMITGAGIDLHAPQVAVAARACLPAAHGVITRADVAEATGSGS
ncbi:MAG TPA: hypothetical protein VME22_28195 [Solirubrobacteraceae bacterium]|nr:hypothetical protein [Solirubrobacteraceae bacterium]